MPIFNLDNQDERNEYAKSDAEKAGQRFTVTLELESFEANTPLEAVQEVLRLMLEFEEGKQSCENMIYDVTDNITGEKFTVDMAEENDEDKVLLNNN